MAGSFSRKKPRISFFPGSLSPTVVQCSKYTYNNLENTTINVPEVSSFIYLLFIIIIIIIIYLLFIIKIIDQKLSSFQGSI